MKTNRHQLPVVISYLPLRGRSSGEQSRLPLQGENDRLCEG